MSDQANGADQRVNGLMAAMGKKETENASLRAKLAEYEDSAQDQGYNTDPGNSQPAQFEEGGLYEFTDGVLAPFEPPTPGFSNAAARSLAGTGHDDGSAEYAKAKLGKALGVTSEKTSWP